MIHPDSLIGDNINPVTAVPLVTTNGMREEPMSVLAALSHGKSMAAVIELIAKLDTTSRMHDAAETVARELAVHLSAGRVFVLWRKNDRRPHRVVADSARGVDQKENRLLDRLVTAAGEEIIARGGDVDWPESRIPHRHALMAVGQLGHIMGYESIQGVGLTAPNDPSSGVLIVVDSTDTTTANFLRMIAMPLTSRLHAIGRLAPTAFEKILRAIGEMVSRESGTVIVAILLIAAVLLLFPFPYRVRTTLELRPVAHRFVAAPFDGPLESAYVRPGDTVQAGELLASINPREIEYELAGIRAELNRAVQERKGMMAEHDSGGSKIAELESDRLRLKSELLQYRRGNLEIRSPLTGIVVTGDLKQSEGMPLNRGDTLFEIAPLGSMVVELEVPEDDFAHVRPGMEVSFYVDALPECSWTGTVQRIHPRAELRDHQNVFIAETEIDDPENVLRPGMSGRAKITSDDHALGWNLFHKPYYALRRVVGW